MKKISKCKIFTLVIALVMLLTAVTVSISANTENFKTNLDSLTGLNGTWNITADGLYSKGSTDIFALSKTVVSDFIYEADITFLSEIGRASLVFRSADKPSTSSYVSYIDKSKNSVVFYEYNNGSWKNYRGVVIKEVKETYHMSVMVFGTSVIVYLDGEEILTTTAENLTSGKLGLLTYNSEVVYQNVMYRELTKDDLHLTNLSVSTDGVLLSPAFKSDTFTYDAELPIGITKLNLSASFNDGASVSYRVSQYGVNVTSGTITNGNTIEITPPFGNSKLYFVITKGDDQLTYIINIHNRVDNEYLASEDYRPQIHFTPEVNFMNDPNGLVYDTSNNTWHMFYQWSPVHVDFSLDHVWGHAVSDDLVNWVSLPVAIPQSEVGLPLSGSAVSLTPEEARKTPFFTEDDIAKFLTGEGSLLVAFYTGTRPQQDQCAAYSTDHGVTWTNYDKFIIEHPYTQDRDPKVFKIDGDDRFYLIVAGSYARLYVSENLADWTLVQDLTWSDGSLVESECPDMYPLAVLDRNGNNTGETKWIYSGCSEWYIIGDMVWNDSVGAYNYKAGEKLWGQTSGKSNPYAAQSYYNDPNGRRITVHWISDYSSKNGLNKSWNGAQSLPLETTLVKYDNGSYAIWQNPVSEVEVLRGTKLYENYDFTIAKSNANVLSGITSQVYEILLTVDMTKTTSNEFGFELRVNGNEKVIFRYDAVNKKLVMDKSNSPIAYERESFSVSLTPDSDGKIRLRAFVDNSALEFFGNDGEAHLIDLYFASSDAVGMNFYSNGGTVAVDSLEIYEMKSIYTGKNVSESAKDSYISIVGTNNANSESAFTLEAALYPMQTNAEFVWNIPEGLTKVSENGNSITLLGTKAGKYTVSVSAFDKTEEFEVTINESKGEINLWLIAGQSNAVGYASDLPADVETDPRYYTGFDNTLFYGVYDNLKNRPTEFVNVTIGRGTNNNSSGSEIGIAKALDSTGEMNAVIKTARGGSWLYPALETGTSKSVGTWTSPSYIAKANSDSNIPDVDTLYTIPNSSSTYYGKLSAGHMYRLFVQTVAEGILMLEKMGYTPVLRGMWWMQGESESNDATQASLYDEVLACFINDVRAEMSAILGEEQGSDMPFVCGNIIWNGDNAPQYIDTINEAQEKVKGELDNVYIVNASQTKSQSFFGQLDEWHYNANTVKYLGEKFVEYVLEANNEYTASVSGNGVSFTGGGIYKNGDSVTVTFSGKDGYTINSVTMSQDGTESITVELTNGSYTFNITKDTTFTVETTYTAALPSTPYGVIGEEYVDAESYPFALFKNGTFVKGYAAWRTAMLAVPSSVSNDEYVILLRRDYTTASIDGTGAARATIAGVKLNVDLGGYNLTRSAGYVFDIYHASTSTYSTNLTVKNGTITSVTDAPVIGLSYSSASANASAKTYNITFNEVTFVNTASSRNTPLITACWEAASANANAGIHANIVLNGCTVDLGNIKNGIAVGLTNAAKNTNSIGTLTVNGGNFIFGGANYSLALYDTYDTVILGSYNGSYPKVTLPTGTNPSNETYKAADGISYETVAGTGVASGDNVVYTYAPNNFSTPYGTIGEAYADVSSYPFAIFNANGFVSCETNFANAMNKANSNMVNKESVIYLRRDYDNTSADSTAGYLTYINGTLKIDLNGYTLARNAKTLFDLYARSNTSGYTTTIDVFNGTLATKSNGAIIAMDYASASDENAVKYYNMKFTNVKFCTSIKLTSGNPFVLVIWDSAKTKEFTTKCSFDFYGCTFDMTNANGMRLFRMYDRDKRTRSIDVDINVYGGEFLNMGTSELAQWDDGDSMNFGKYDGKYPTFTTAAGVAFKDINTTFGLVGAGGSVGAVKIVKISETETTIVYSVVPVEVSNINFTPKTSITLGSELVYNVYVPVMDCLKSFTVDGKTHDNLIPVTLDDGNQYYHIAVPMAASEAARNVVLKATVTIDGKDYTGTWTMSIPKYSKKVLTSDANATEKTLIKDVLAYIKAAYIYFDAYDKAEAVKVIDEILGDYNHAFSKVEGTTNTNNGLWGVVIVLEDKPAIRFVLPEGVTADSYTFKAGNTVLDFTIGTMTVENKTYNYAEVSLYAYQMIREITYTNGTVSGSYHINSYYDYVTTDDELKNDTNLISLVEKLYNYCKSAEVYRASVTNK